MTREEIINEIKCLLSELDNGEDAVSYLTQNDVKWLKENIKALERQNVLFKSGLLKDCETCRALEQGSVLDKVRTEIERLQKMCDKNDLNLMAQYSAFGMVLDVIDKYKVESEMQDADGN